MDALSSINWLDLAIVLTLICGMVVGFAQGALRQLLWLLSVYFAIVLSAQYYQLVGYYLALVSPTMIVSVAQVIGFFILLAVSGIVLTIMITDALRHVANRPVGTLSHLSGGVIGLFAALIFVCVTLIAINFLTLTAWPGPSEAFRKELFDLRAQSSVVALFRSVFPLVLQTLRPWLPTLPPLFTAEFPNPINAIR